LRPTGLWIACQLDTWSIIDRLESRGTNIKVIGLPTGTRVGRGWGSESAIYWERQLVREKVLMKDEIKDEA
jgi:hypothetical protein